MSSKDFIRTAFTGRQNLRVFIKYYLKTNDAVMSFKFSRAQAVLNELSKKFNIRITPNFNELIEDIKNLDAVLNKEKKEYGIGGGTKFNNLVLYFLVKKLKPKIVIETGVAAGVSSYFILKAMHENKKGKLISIDLPNYTNSKGYINKDGLVDKVYTPKTKGVGWVVPENFRKNWQLILGDSMKVLPQIKDKIDIFYHDSDHSYTCMNFEYNWAKKQKIRYVSSDDINSNNAWYDFINKNRLTSINIEGFGVTKFN